jgi:hypothetical protein
MASLEYCYSGDWRVPPYREFALVSELRFKLKSALQFIPNFTLRWQLTKEHYSLEGPDTSIVYRSLSFATRYVARELIYERPGNGKLSKPKCSFQGSKSHPQLAH